MNGINAKLIIALVLFFLLASAAYFFLIPKKDFETNVEVDASTVNDAHSLVELSKIVTRKPLQEKGPVMFRELGRFTADKNAHSGEIIETDNVWSTEGRLAYVISKMGGRGMATEYILYVDGKEVDRSKNQITPIDYITKRLAYYIQRGNDGGYVVYGNQKFTYFGQIRTPIEINDKLAYIDDDIRTGKVKIIVDGGVVKEFSRDAEVSQLLNFGGKLAYFVRDKNSGNSDIYSIEGSKLSGSYAPNKSHFGQDSISIVDGKVVYVSSAADSSGVTYDEFLVSDDKVVSRKYSKISEIYEIENKLAFLGFKDGNSKAVFVFDGVEYGDEGVIRTSLRYNGGLVFFVAKGNSGDETKMDYEITTGMDVVYSTKGEQGKEELKTNIGLEVSDNSLLFVTKDYSGGIYNLMYAGKKYPVDGTIRDAFFVGGKAAYVTQKDDVNSVETRLFIEQ